MSEKRIVIPAGTPNDDNREYLPLAIKGSDMVVNENGNNSQPYPARLEECTGDIVGDGEPDRWYVYVPESYDPSKKTPLVLSMHGGLMTGWGQAIYTSWTLVADREGFICVFPDAHSRMFWTVEHDPKLIDEMSKPNPSGLYLNRPPEKIEDNRDVQFVLALIKLMESKYNIDEGRIYMQGMSMGNLFTHQFVRYFGNMLAGAAGAGGPTNPVLLYDEDGKMRNRAGNVDFWQSCPELNGGAKGATLSEFEVIRINLEYLNTINEVSGLPQISVKGESNFAFYTGKKADTVLLDIKNRDHGQTLDDAEIVWDYFFSGSRREADGTITHTKPIIERKGDDISIAIAKDCSKAWLNGKPVELTGPTILWQKLKYHGLDGGEKVRGEYLCVPLSFVAEVCGAKYEKSADTLSATLTLPDGSTCSFSRGSIGCVYNNRVEAMLCEALHRHGELFIPFEWFAGRVMNLHFSECNDVLYATDHWNVLSTNLANLFKLILLA